LQGARAEKVILVGTRRSRLDMGARLGADVVVDARREDAVAAVAQGGRPAWRGRRHRGVRAQEAPQQCLELVRRGGKVLIVAFYKQPVTLDLGRAVREDVTIYGTRGEGGNNVRRALSLVAQGRSADATSSPIDSAR